MQTQRMKSRKQLLHDLQKLLPVFRAEIRYSAKPLERLVAENESSVFCKKAMESPLFKDNPCLALQSAGEQLLGNREDRRTYFDFVNGLGVSDRENQMNHIALYETLIGKQESEAAEDYAKRSKLCMAMGLFGGITLSMLII